MQTPSLSRSVLGLVCLGSLTGGLAFAGDCPSPPPNEDCDSAIVFGGADLPFTTSGLIGCSNDEVDKPYWDIFYQFDCDVTGDYTVAMCDSEMDTYLRVWVDGCGWSDGDELAVGDDECPGSPPNADPMITVALKAGQSYWIELGTWRPDSFWGAPNIPFNFTMELELPPCPADTDGNGAVDVDDIINVILDWTTDGSANGGDVDDNNVVNVDDLVTVILSFGVC